MGPTTDACATTVQFDFSQDTTLRLHQRGWTAIQIWEVEINYRPTTTTTLPPTSTPSLRPVFQLNHRPSRHREILQNHRPSRHQDRHLNLPVDLLHRHPPQNHSC